MYVALYKMINYYKNIIKSGIKSAIVLKKNFVSKPVESENIWELNKTFLR